MTTGRHGVRDCSWLRAGRPTTATGSQSLVGRDDHQRPADRPSRSCRLLSRTSLIARCFIAAHDPDHGRRELCASTRRIPAPGRPRRRDLGRPARGQDRVHASAPGWLPGSYDPELDLLFMGHRRAAALSVASCAASAWDVGGTRTPCELYSQLDAWRCSPGSGRDWSGTTSTCPATTGTRTSRAGAHADRHGRGQPRSVGRGDAGSTRGIAGSAERRKVVVTGIPGETGRGCSCSTARPASSCGRQPLTVRRHRAVRHQRHRPGATGQVFGERGSHLHLPWRARSATSLSVICAAATSTGLLPAGPTARDTNLLYMLASQHAPA